MCKYGLERHACHIVPEHQSAIIACHPTHELFISRHATIGLPPKKKMPSEFTLIILIIALCLLKLNMNTPLGHFHFLMLFPPAEPDVKLYSVGTGMDCEHMDQLFVVHELHHCVDTLKGPLWVELGLDCAGCFVPRE